MTRKALGRGLSALLSDTPVTTAGEQVQDVDIHLIEPSTLQPRTNFDESRLDALAQSIRANGIIQPILVRRIGNDRFQLVAGERRWRAAQRAGLLRVPCIVREIPEDRVLELALVENIQRQELNPIEEALAYKRLIETLGLTQETVAQRVGRDRTVITNHLRLLRLPEDIQHLVEQESLSMGHARAVLGLDDAAAVRKLAQAIIKQGMSVRDTERAVKRILEGPASKGQSRSAQRSEDANVKAAENKLRRRLGSKVQILTHNNGEGGKIEIEYYNMGDLDRIYRLILGSESADAAST
jgi:ParB family transcriptional regulator, chromosome partitioning protein